MLLLLGFLLVPAVFAAKSKINNYNLDIDECHTLKSITPTKESASELNLSNLGLESIDKAVFQNLDNVKILNLANNSLYGVPAFVFANLTNLEHLSLAGNKMARFENTFVGLGSLKSLNISNLPLEHLSQGYLYGLTKATDIWVLNNKFTIIASDCFDQGRDFDEPRRRKRSSEEAMEEDIEEEDSKEEDIKEGDIKEEDIKEEDKTESTLRDPYYKEPIRIKVCIREGSLNLVEILKKEDTLTSNCTEVQMKYYYPSLSLTNLGITTFDKGWYQVNTEGESHHVRSVFLDGNNIVRVTSDLLNDLPKQVKLVSLVGNKIERLEKGVIENNHILDLDLGKNFISEIEDGALEKMSLSVLRIRDNRLKDTKFAATLPSTLNVLQMERNGITELTAGSFSKLSKMSSLHLKDNNITSLQSGSLQGLASLKSIDLTSNGLNKIEPGSFKHLKSVQNLDLPKNSISSLEKGVFDDFEANVFLNLASNKFTKITKDTLADLPKNLEHLYLDNNEIEILEAGSFVKLPKSNLALNGNKISRIEKGAFDLPELETLTLSGNLLSSVDGDSFESLGNLATLNLSYNRITRINKGAMKNLGSLRFLDISGNPIKRLDNGALFGIQKSPPRWIHLTEGSLEVLQGGLFDDA